jgi:UDP-N-acetylglucosamine--N-acetylmuramyl-(pentapeptide) pyrophosphoryl-undecaprenol N-acetylglucosamine transferase
MRVIMAGGGTGGHLFPGLAVARALKEQNRMTAVLFVGTDRGIEGQTLPREGFALETLPIKGIKGRGLRGLLEAAYGIPVSLIRSLGIIRRFQPDCILGLGGYASGPLLLAAKIRGVPCAIMEQNLRPGLTNRILGYIVDRIFVSYEKSSAFFPRGRVVFTGNPVRWRELPGVVKSQKLTLLVFGGSAGAHKINQSMVEALDYLEDLAPGLTILHQTGAADYAWVKEGYESRPFDATVFPFIEKMDEAYARADLVLCRSGATTIAELTAYGKPAILVPYPYAAHDHQRLNAEALRLEGAAEMILDRELSGEILARSLRKLLQDRERLRAMGRSARILGKPEAAEKIVDECRKLVPDGSQEPEFRTQN